MHSLQLGNVMVDAVGQTAAFVLSYLVYRALKGTKREMAIP
jgi:hypothetical protein